MDRAGVNTPPPVQHVLRPHHIDLIALFLLVFKEFQKKLPSSFLLHVYRLLLEEVSEVTIHKLRPELLDKLKQMPDADEDQAGNLIAALETLPSQLDSADKLNNFFHSMPVMFVDKSEDEPAPISRRSLFGFFCRRCFISFLKLSWYSVCHLHADYQSYTQGHYESGYGPFEKDYLTQDIWVFKTGFDVKSWARPDPLAAAGKGLASGDSIIGPENLRRYFEQHFHDHPDSGVRQHALLYLARMHFGWGETTAVRNLLQEAISVARGVGDRYTLQQCTSLINRLPSATPVLTEIQPDVHPADVLHDVAKLMNPENGQPLMSAFEKLFQATGLYDYWFESRRNMVQDWELRSLHSMQAVLWENIGCVGLAEVEENMVSAFAERVPDVNRKSVIFNRVRRLARNGAYEGALALLLHTDTWMTLNHTQYVEWAEQVWHVLVIRAIRRGQHQLFNNYLKPRRPSSIDISEYVFDDVCVSKLGSIRAELHEVIRARRHGQAVAAIQPLLHALWLSEFQCRFPLYRLGIILLADIGLEFGLTTYCRRLLEEVLPQLRKGDDIEHRALAYFTYARCLIACSPSGSEEGLREALVYLKMAEDDYKKLEITESIADVQFLTSVVYHNLGETSESERTGERHLETNVLMQKYGEALVDEEVSRIWEVVSRVGISIAGQSSDPRY